MTNALMSSAAVPAGREVPGDRRPSAEFPLKSLCIIIGAMKAGTSSLFNWLAEHPQICPSIVKEPYFFAIEDKYRQGHRAYFELWNANHDHKLALEGSTDYTKFPYVIGVPERLKALENTGYRLKLIYVMRHPVARIESHIRHLYLHHCDVLDRPVNLAPLEAGLLDRFIAFSSYAYQLDQFGAVFDRSQIKLVSFEKMIADPLMVLNDVYGFLGLDVPEGGFIPRNGAVNLSESIRNWEYLPNYYRFLTEGLLVKKGLAPLIPERWKSKVRSKLARGYAYRTDLTDGEKSLALERLKPDLVRLRDDWHFDAAQHWNLAL